MASRKAPPEEFDIAGHTVRLTSPDKVCFPRKGYTKRDVFEYYLAVGDGIMRALRDRPTTLQRFPDGIEGEMFFQKRIATRGVPPWVQTAKIKFPSRRTADELCPADLAHVAWAAQMGTIVFHPWPVRSSSGLSTAALRTGHGWKTVVPICAAQATCARSAGQSSSAVRMLGNLIFAVLIQSGTPRVGIRFW